MAGIIVGWDDVIANIPSGWNLCNGTSGTPNLLDKYLKSVGTSEDPGTTGGATTHTHTSDAHNHTQDAHTHSGNSSTPSGTVKYSVAGAAYSSTSHVHPVSFASLTATNQTTTVVLDAVSNDPPYYKLAFIYDSATSRYPVNSIILWNSATLPNGWSLHTGLKNVFAKSVGSGEDPGGTGGSSNSHTHTNTTHNHTQDSHTHSVTVKDGSIDSVTFTEQLNIFDASHLSHFSTHSPSGGAATATNQTSSVTIANGDGQPTYYKLLYIKNTGGATNRPKNCIVIWSGTVANIPIGYVLCDGNNSTPNLLDYFIKGANDSSELGNTGGSATHNHTTSSHNHTQDSHSHTITLGNSSQSTTGYNVGVSQIAIHKIHTHSGSVSDTATNQATTIVVNSTNSEPAYYEVAFIMQNRELDMGTFAFMM